VVRPATECVPVPARRAGELQPDVWRAHLAGRPAAISGWLLLSAGIVWAGAIAYAALATKQHYAIDVPAGVVLAWVAHRWSWRDITLASTGRAMMSARTVAGSGQ
jgi:membrane-associated phospholipid phosphatase